MKIAIVDSGVHVGHPHVPRVAGGVGIVTGDYLDRLGHGTAVAGAILEKVPEAEIYAVKVFDRRLSANIDTIVRALEWCAGNGMDLINLSLGTANPAHRERLAGLSGIPLVVSVPDFVPGSIPVLPDETCPREVFRYREGIFYTSPYPRSIPGVPDERNLHGASFAVANMTGFVARALADTSSEAILRELIARAANNP